VAETKQDLLDEITDMLGMDRRTLHKGSSLPVEVFEEAKRRVGVSGNNMPEIAEAVIRKAGMPWMASYDSRGTPSRGGSTVTRSGLRAFADAIATLLRLTQASGAYLLTWNPANGSWPESEIAAEVDATARGQIVYGRWSTGSRTTGIRDGERAFLLRQGIEPRGIVGAGKFRSSVSPGEHWDGSGGSANYAWVDWDSIVGSENPLPLAALKRAMPQHNWEPQGSGTHIPIAETAILEGLWTDHVRKVRAGSGGGQARQLDAERRKKTEDAAQQRLMQHYRDRGWHVEDTHIGNPFDARATKGAESRYLEAKGTTTPGSTVIVTRNEIEHARQHRGECVIGIWSDISFDSNGDVAPLSGVFRIIAWEPKNAELFPIAYDWKVGGTQLHP
jgi:hypothetical protein